MLRRSGEDQKDGADLSPFRRLFDDVVAALAQADLTLPEDEDGRLRCESIAGAVIPRLQSCAGNPEVAGVIQEEFDRWFGAAAAAPTIRYEELAEQVLQLWRAYAVAAPPHSS